MIVSSLAPRTPDVLRGGAHRMSVMAPLAILVLTAALPFAAMAAPPVTIPGILTQPAPPDGCASNDGTGGNCAAVGNLVGAQAVAVSPDNLHVYVTAFDVDAILVFSRDKKTSVLTKVDCYTNNASPGCTQVKPLTQPYAVAVTPDGKFVYVSVQGSDAVLVFARDKKTGKLTKQSCVGRGGNGGCTHPIQPLNHPQGLAISKDGKFVFVAVRVSDAVIAFTRDKKTGKLTKVNCVSNTAISAGCTVGVALDDPRDVAVSKDSKNVYVASKGSNAVVVLSIDKKTGAIAPLEASTCVSADGTGGSCDIGKALDAPLRLDVSPDGKHVYVASNDSHAIAMFSRGKEEALTQIGCISNDGSGGDCDTADALAGAASVAVSADGKNVYVAAKLSNAVGVYLRDKKTGLLTQLSPTDGCVSLDGTGGACATGIALDGAQDVAVTPDGSGVYVTAGDSKAVAVFSRAD